MAGSEPNGSTTSTTESDGGHPADDPAEVGPPAGGEGPGEQSPLGSEQDEPPAEQPGTMAGLPPGRYAYTSQSAGSGQEGPASPLTLDVGRLDSHTGEQQLDWVDDSGDRRVEVYRWSAEALWLTQSTAGNGERCTWDPALRWIRFPLSDRTGWVLESVCRVASGEAAGSFNGSVERLPDEEMQVGGVPTEVIVLRREDVEFASPRLTKRTLITDRFRASDLVLVKRVREHHQSVEGFAPRTSTVVEELVSEP